MPFWSSALLAVVVSFAACEATALAETKDRSVSLATLHLRLDGGADAAHVESLLYERSDPDSELYRQHLDLSSLAAIVGASDQQLAAATRAVTALFTTQHVKAAPVVVTVSPTRDFISVEGVALARLLSVVGKSSLNEVLEAIERSRHGKAGIRREQLETQLRGLFRYAVVVLHAPRANRRRSHPWDAAVLGSSASSGSSGSDGTHCPNCQTPQRLSDRYRSPSWNPSNRTSYDESVLARVPQAVAEFEQEQFILSNIQAFNKAYGAAAPNINVSGPNAGGYFGEGQLDLDYINVLAGYPGETTTWWVAANEFDLIKVSDRLMQISPLPLVFSISWGSGESGFDVTMMDSDNEVFKKLGLLGVSVLAASGDEGTGSTGFFSCGTFDPTWPAASPYVTAVGGTTVTDVTATETAWSRSGGGFSNVNQRPAYQHDAVERYLTSFNASLPPASFWNRTGRALPDVSALATNFEVFSNGWGTESGTSAATPTFAAFLTRINIERVHRGLKSVGFVNHALYKAAASTSSGGSAIGFDVVEGNNKVSACSAGFNAEVGWDPISGLGTPLYPKLAAILLAEKF